MEQTPSLFSLSIDEHSKLQLLAVSKWAKILAFAGIAAVVLIVTNALSLYVSKSFLRGDFSNGGEVAEKIGEVFGFFLVILIPVLCFIYVLRFSKALRIAIEADDQRALNKSFQNLKISFRYTAVLAICFTALMALSFILKFVSSQAGH